jgi:chromosome segregation ATPase
MSDRAERIEQLKGRLLGLEVRGRDFRSTIGRAMDELAADLSAKARERDELAAERERLEREREALAERARKGDAAAVAEADAALWRLAASEEVLRDAVVACEDIEYQLAELGRQLERLSEALEADQSELIADIDATLQQIARDDDEMRALEAAVSSQWSVVSSQ